MFNKYQNVFRSRWKALWWAAGILMTAYCTVPSPDENAAVPGAQASSAPLAKAPAEETDNSWMLGASERQADADPPSHS